MVGATNVAGMSTRRAEAAIYAVDPERLADFYCAVAHFERVEQEPGFVALRSAQYDVILVRIRPDLAAEITISEPAQRREDTPIKLVLSVDDLRSAREAAHAHGGVIDEPEHEWTWRGLTRCDGHDPEGNVFQAAVPA